MQRLIVNATFTVGVVVLVSIHMASAEEKAPGESFRDRLVNGQSCSDCPEMVVIPAGSFMMGSPPIEEGRSTTNPEPLHRVTIARPFAIGKFEVTFGEWDTCVAAGDCRRRPDDRGTGRGKQPVSGVTWNDVTNEFLPWLSRKTGKPYRLPTEAEWEYAARAGTTTPFWWGSSISTDLANYNGNFTYAGGSKGEYRQKALSVDSFAANPWGLYNVHGNVGEFVQDCWSDGPAPLDGLAWTAEDCHSRVHRGGGFDNVASYLRSAGRWVFPDSASSPALGFRLARSLYP
jgi:formylglycine-generating enzyme required for sulfatase activity